jgi:PAS domain S-box-containing protein
MVKEIVQSTKKSTALVLSTRPQKTKEKQLILNPKKMIVTQTDDKGNIIYVNDYFTKITGYSISDVYGMPHNIIRHPDMPRAIFYLMWDRIQNGKNIKALVKNRTKSGEYYWVVTDFEIKEERKHQKATYIAYRHGASQGAIRAIEPLYAHLRQLESTHGMEASLNYIQSFLEVRHTNYDDFMKRVIKQDDGILKKFVNRFKKIILFR